MVWVVFIQNSTSVDQILLSPWIVMLAEALGARKGNTYPEYGSVQVRMKCSPFQGRRLFSSRYDSISRAQDWSLSCFQVRHLSVRVARRALARESPCSASIFASIAILFMSPLSKRWVASDRGCLTSPGQITLPTWLFSTLFCFGNSLVAISIWYKEKRSLHLMCYSCRSICMPLP